MDKELEKILSEYQYSGISVIHTNLKDIDYEEYYGYADLENKIKTTKDNIYRIASISKVEIALGIMKLYEMGKLDFYEDISVYLGYLVRNPKYPNDIITLEMLMTQTSSISDRDETIGKGYDGINGPLIEVSLKELLTNPSYKYYTDLTYSNYKPGTHWDYSNFGCGICACIIEKVSGMGFNDFLKKYLFNPLNIDASYYYSELIDHSNTATLYELENNQLVICRNHEIFTKIEYPKYDLGNNFRGPAGGLFITPANLAKIMMMLMNNGIYNNIRLFKEETILEMKKIHWQGESYDPEYKKKGLQLLLLDGYSKETLMGHFGCAYGLRSFMLFNQNNGYIFMCNGADYKEDADHMVKMEEDILKYLINKFENKESTYEN